MTEALKREGVVGRAGARVSVAPPLVINREEIDTLVDRIDRAITSVERELAIG